MKWKFVFIQWALTGQQTIHTIVVCFPFIATTAKNKVAFNDKWKVWWEGPNMNPFLTSIYGALLELYKSFDWGTNRCQFYITEGIRGMDVKSLKVFQHHCPEVSLCFARTNPTQPNKMAFNFSYFLPPFYLPENPFIFVNVINCV